MICLFDPAPKIEFSAFGLIDPDFDDAPIFQSVDDIIKSQADIDPPDTSYWVYQARNLGMTQTPEERARRDEAHRKYRQWESVLARARQAEQSVRREREERILAESQNRTLGENKKLFRTLKRAFLREFPEAKITGSAKRGIKIRIGKSWVILKDYIPEHEVWSACEYLRRAHLGANL